MPLKKSKGELMNFEKLEDRILTAPCPIDDGIRIDHLAGHSSPQHDSFWNKQVVKVTGPGLIGLEQSRCEAEIVVHWGDGDSTPALRVADRYFGHVYNHAGLFTIEAEVNGEVMASLDWQIREWPFRVGDVDHNQLFDSTDLVIMFQYGKYETGEHAHQYEGDFNGDDLFDSSDMVLAMQKGYYRGVE